MMYIVFGSDLALRALTLRVVPEIDEAKLRQVLEPELVANGGNVADFTFVSQCITAQMAASSREPLYEYALGSGLITKKSMIGPLQTNIVEEGMFEALTLDYVFYPQELIDNG